MPELIWNPTDFTACLETVPEVDEYATKYHYTVKKHGIRLELSVYPYAGDVYITLCRDGIDTPLIDFRLIGCSGTRYVRDKRGEFLEFAPAQVFGDRFRPEFVIPVGLRLSVTPSIRLEFF